MRKLLLCAGVIVGWLFILYGAIRAGGAMPVLYMLMTGQVEPGEPYYLGDPAPTRAEAIASSAIAFGSIAVGFGFKTIWAKLVRNETRGA